MTDTYPDTFYPQAVTVGPPQTKHPIYTFHVNLAINTTEAIGPRTNQRITGVLQPDQYQSSSDQGRTEFAARLVQRITWLPGLLAAGNVEINNNGTITAYGPQGTYLYQNFTTGTNPLLTVVNSPPFTSP